MIDLILLAAGNSRRFGEDKLMWELDGKPMARHMLDLLSEIASQRNLALTVVTKDGPVAEMAKNTCARVIINHRSEDGISTSIHGAIDAISGDNPAVFFVADQPYMKKETITGFIDGYVKSGKGLGCVCHDGETGNPCAFDPGYFDELLAITGDRGGKRVIKQHPEDLYLYEVSDERELLDIDTK